MKRLVIAITLLSLILVACIPAAAATPQPVPSPTATRPAAVKLESTPAKQAQPVATDKPKGESRPTRQARPASAAKPKGKNPPSATASTNPDFIATEILGRPTNTSITVNVVPAVAMKIYYEYGTAAGVYTAQTTPQPASAGVPLETLVDGLRPNTRYYYRIRYGDQAGHEYTFVTQRAPGSTFTFTVQADSHLDSYTSPDLYLRTLANALADRPDFHIDLGDTFMTDKYQPYTGAAAQYLAQRYDLSLVGRAAPLFLALGNHDGESLARPDAGAGSMSAWSAQLRTRYFPNPIPDDFYTGNSTPDGQAGLLQDYYAWEWGDALFVVLDPYRFTPARRGCADNWCATLGQAQYQWLQATLANSRASFKFVFIHQLVGGVGDAGRGGAEAARFFEWGGYNSDGSWGFDDQRPGWGKPIHQVLVENHVTAVFHGHDHLFVKQELDGIIYQTVPQPGALRSAAARLAQEYGYDTGQVVDGSGHLRVTVAPAQITLDFIRADLAANKSADVAFTYSILKWSIN